MRAGMRAGMTAGMTVVTAKSCGKTMKSEAVAAVVAVAVAVGKMQRWGRWGVHRALRRGGMAGAALRLSLPRPFTEASPPRYYTD
jgi:hypothetical protein